MRIFFGTVAVAALFVFGGSYLYNHVTDKRETEGSTYSLTRFDYVGAPKHLYGSVARAAGYLDGKRITLTDPAESACTKQCMRSKRADSVKSNEVFEFCISECRINPLEAGVFDGTTYPELYYGHIRDKQSSSTGDLNATKSLRYWLGNSSNDNRVMIDKFMPAFESINSKSLSLFGFPVFRSPMMLENSTVGLYLTELAESKLQSVMPFIERSAYILFHDIGRLSLDPHGFAIYQHNGAFVVKLDPALYMSKVESVLGLKAKSEFYAFGPRGGRVSYWPSLSLRDARKWSSSYAPYSKSFYVNSKQLAFIDPLESERDYPVVGSDGLTMKVDNALVKPSNGQMVLSTNKAYGRGLVYIEAIYRTGSWRNKGKVWFSLVDNPMKEHTVIPAYAKVASDSLRRVSDGDRVMLLLDFNRGLFHIGRNGDWALGMDPRKAGKPLSDRVIYKDSLYVVGFGLDNVSKWSSWEIVRESEQIYNPMRK